MAEVLNFADIKKLDNKAIDAKVQEARTEIFNLRMQKNTAGIDKPHKFDIHRKNIARLLTAKNSK
jgi:large subunit ribosomal protein L29